MLNREKKCGKCYEVGGFEKLRFLRRIFRKGLSKRGTFSRYRYEAASIEMSGSSIPGKGTSKCKGLEALSCSYVQETAWRSVSLEKRREGELSWSGSRS